MPFTIFNTMKSIPMDPAGRLVIPKEIRLRLGLHAGDRFKAEVGPDQITLTRLRTDSCRIIPHNGRKVWDAPGAIATEADFESALGRARKDRDQRASGL